MFGMLVRVIVRTLAGHHIDLRSSNTATADLAHLEARAHVQRRCCFGKHLKRNARIDKRAQQHIAADAGEALQISNSHAS